MISEIAQVTVSDGTNGASRCASAGLWLFLTFFALYALAAPGNLAGDTEVRWSIARQIVRANGLHIEEDLQTNNFVFGPDGKRYSYYGLGQSLLMAPFAALALAAEASAVLNPATADLAAQFLTSIILFPAIGAMLILLFSRLVLSLGCSRTVALAMAVLLGAATMIFHYSVNGQEQTQIAVLLVLALILAVRYFDNSTLTRACLFCLALGACLVFRSASAIMILPIYLVVALADAVKSTRAPAQSAARWLVAGLLGVGPAIALCAAYNYVRFASPLESGYSLVAETAMGGHTMFESSPLPTLAAMLASPGKSILLYNPLLILFPLCIRRFYRKSPVITLASLAAILANFIFYSFCTTWAGDYAWGLRYQVPVIALLLLPLAAILDRPIKPALRAIIITLAATSCVIQLSSIVYNFNLEFVQNPNHCLIPDAYVWDLSQSHLKKRFANIADHLTSNRDFSSTPVATEEPRLLKTNRTEHNVRAAYHLNTFPFKARATIKSKKIFAALLSIWILLAIFLALAAQKLLGKFRAARRIHAALEKVS